MNVNRLYVAQIYVNYECKLESDLLFYRRGKYLKNALVYHDDYHDYIDMISGEKYKLGIEGTDLGDMYINLQNGLRPVNEVFDVQFKRTNMGKRRILKNLCNSKLLNKKEDDK